MSEDLSYLIACASCGEEQRVIIHFTRASIDGVEVEDPLIEDLQNKAKAARDPIMKEGYRQLADRRVGTNALLKTFAARAPAVYREFGRDAFRPEPSAESEDDTI